MEQEKHKERAKLVGAVHLLLLRGNQVLLLRRFNTGYRDGEYSVIAGHLDGDEPACKAMSREAREETGIEVEMDNLDIAHFMHRKSTDERIDFFFTTKKWNGTPYIIEAEKCDDLRWFPLNNLPSNMVPYVREAIENYKKGILYSEFGWIEPDLQ